MATIERFEDIEAWKKARLLAQAVYRTSAQGVFSRDFGLRNQMRRAAVSAVSNIAEGFERGGNKEFRQFLASAKGSAGEVRAQLYVALDAGLVSQAEFDQLRCLAEDVSRLLAGFMEYLSHTALDGHKFKGSAKPNTRQTGMLSEPCAPSR